MSCPPLRILLLAHSFNGLTQRLWCELEDRGHAVSLELDIADDVTREAVRLHAPDLVLAPFLKRAIPEDVWRAVPCWIVHPGIPGDRGPAALDWAILEGRTAWGVTVLEANAEFDAGDVWASASFPMRAAAKASLYRDEVTNAAATAVLDALAKRAGGGRPTPLAALDPATAGTWHPSPKQAERRVDWARDPTAVVLAKLHAADSSPGLVDEVLGVPCRLYGARPGPSHAEWRRATRAAGMDARASTGVEAPEPGAWLGRRDDALLRATVDGSVWIARVRLASGEVCKLPPALAVPAAAALPECPPFAGGELAEIAYREDGEVGFLAFDFPDGAMGTAQCGRLGAALADAAARPTRVLVLEGGRDFWSNGVHLHLIEAADSPADESWRNIQAIDDVAEAILTLDGKLTVAALRGNAGAGGAFLALAADHVWSRPGVVLNLHYRNMGNLYGSEYWTYTLPRRVGEAEARRLIDERPPLLARQALARGLVDAAFGGSAAEFDAEVAARAHALARGADFAERLAAKRARRAADEAAQPLAAHRAAELAQMRRSFYGFDTSYHVARHRFVHRAPHSWTPRHLARHRGGAAR